MPFLCVSCALLLPTMYSHCQTYLVWPLCFMYTYKMWFSVFIGFENISSCYQWPFVKRWSYVVLSIFLMLIVFLPLLLVGCWCYCCWCCCCFFFLLVFFASFLILDHSTPRTLTKQNKTKEKDTRRQRNEKHRNEIISISFPKEKKNFELSLSQLLAVI